MPGKTQTFRGRQMRWMRVEGGEGKGRGYYECAFAAQCNQGTSYWEVNLIDTTFTLFSFIVNIK